VFNVGNLDCSAGVRFAFNSKGAGVLDQPWQGGGALKVAQTWRASASGQGISVVTKIELRGFV